MSEKRTQTHGAAPPEELAEPTPFPMNVYLRNEAELRAFLADHAAPGREPAMNDGKLWSWVRDVMGQGAAIRMDYVAGSYSFEEYNARLDAAASERAIQLTERLAAPPDEPTAGREGAKDKIVELARRWYHTGWGKEDVAHELAMAVMRLETAAPAEEAQPAEPVAWIHPEDLETVQESGAASVLLLRRESFEAYAPLYTAPPASQVRAQALEEAAKEAEHWQEISRRAGDNQHKCGEYIAAAIRALKDQP